MKRTILISSAIFVTVVSILWYKCNQDYYAEYNDVKSELKKMNGVEVIKLWGNEDIELEDIYAVMRLDNGDTLRFSSLGKWSFDPANSHGLTITQINNWKFHSTGCTSGGHWGGGGLQVNKNSEYDQIKELHLRNVHDVITHIDKLKNIVKNISIHPKFD